MANKFHIEVTESLNELKQLLKKQTSAQGKERLQMLYWLKRGELTTRQSLAERLNRDESTIYRWVQKYKRGGLDSLLEVKTAPGQEPKINGETLEKLKKRLAQRDSFPTYGAIQEWLKQNCGIEVPYSTVHRTVRTTLKTKLKPTRSRSSSPSPSPSPK